MILFQQGKYTKAHATATKRGEGTVSVSDQGRVAAQVRYRSQGQDAEMRTWLRIQQTL